ncbi:hypothetical protein MMAGJ_67590 [Mycolicibacterium mageritense]|uniref:Uncharacterized protein n=1 Tax=Mycolicibacterium mageritense TaxID=53462 RepID=A0ABM7I3K9_MYCME|nr:hypothetical protein MMAGJ_67590 [Mycolicibacterium mageritense]
MRADDFRHRGCIDRADNGELNGFVPVLGKKGFDALRRRDGIDVNVGKALPPPGNLAIEFVMRRARALVPPCDGQDGNLTQTSLLQRAFDHGIVVALRVDGHQDPFGAARCGTR